MGLTMKFLNCFRRKPAYTLRDCDVCNGIFSCLKTQMRFCATLVFSLFILMTSNAFADRDCSSYTVWAAGTAYNKWDFVQYQGKAYQCIDRGNCRSSDSKYKPGTGSRYTDAWNYQDVCMLVSSSSSSRSSSSSSSVSSTSSSRSSSSSSSTSSSSSVISSSSSSSSSSSTSSSISEPSQVPLFLKSSAKPHIALVMSLDQELSKKAYSDYSNLDGGLLSMADTTYRNNFSYYGYFNSDWCYTYNDTGTASTSHFTPSVQANNHQCAASTAWSGNFLNWVSMTRMDILRKVLFGGKRSVDSTTQTILERAYIPSDVHAFVKVYDAADIALYTPFANASGSKRSFCNVSTDSTTNGYPVIRTAAANTTGYYSWASTEGSQCQFGANSAPATGDVYTAKVAVCVANKDENNNSYRNDRCRLYGTGTTVQKPIGLLQVKGEDANIKFSLTTNSYKAHLNGGVVRKLASTLVDDDTDKHGDSDDEINLDDGTFNTGVSGIIKNINLFRVAGYGSAVRNYSDCNTHSISITTVKAGATNNQTCTDWGNPIAEIYLEMLRYISGAGSDATQNGPTSGFLVDDSTASTQGFVGIPGLTSVSTWTAPWTDWCGQCAAIVISTGSNSFDGDDLDSAADVVGLTNGASVKAKTDAVGELEYPGFNAIPFYMGERLTGTNALNCARKTVAGLSDVAGICPELPALEGTYNIAGLAYHAHTTDLISGLQNQQSIDTYTVDLAESIPTFEIKIGSNTVSLAPACEAAPAGVTFQSCTLTNVVIENLQRNAGGDIISGSMYFTWEDSTWGNDYDLDAGQQISFCVGAACNDSTNVSANQIRIISTVPYSAAGNAMHLGYSIYGVSSPTVAEYFEGATVYEGGGVAAQNSGAIVFKRGATTLNAMVGHEAFAAGWSGGVIPWMVRPGGQNSTTLATVGANVEASKIIFTAQSATVTTLKKPLWMAAKYGGFTDVDKNNQFDAGTDEWKSRNDVTGSPGVPDNFYSVKNPATLEENLRQIIDDIQKKTGSASAVATASTRLNTDGYVYQAAFNSGTWTGELRGYQPDQYGVLPALPTKTTTTLAAGGTIVADSNNMQIFDTGRNIYTYVSGSTLLNGTTVDFAWGNLSTAMKASLTLANDNSSSSSSSAASSAASSASSSSASAFVVNGTNRVAWIRGDATNEDKNSGFRPRTFYPTSGLPYRNILGDIVNSSPVYEGVFDFKYSGLTSGGSTYRTFLASKRARMPLVFVGANDGMLHAFKAKDTSSSQPDAFREVFAYIPSMVFHKLAKMSKPNYGTAENPHQFSVDGNIAVGDAYFTVGSQTKWRSIVAGSLGAGGKGIYVLDVTDVTPSTPQPTVLFEYTHADMGFVMGQMFVLPTQDGRWVLVFGNGDYTGTTSKLFLVDLEDPSGRTQIINTGSGTGLSSPAILRDALGRLESVYAGDVDGNMWHFYYDTAGAVQSYKAFTTLQSGQPITAAPTIGYNDFLKKYMMYFGTGRYYKDNDNLIGGQQQYFYAVPDMGVGGTPAVSSTLVEKTMNTNYSTATRTISGATPNWNTTIGWFMKLDHSSNIRNERMISKVLLLQDKLLITTLLPNAAACEAGGKSWFMEVPAIGDKPPACVVCSGNKLEDQLFLGATNVSILPPGSSGATSSAASSGSASSASSSSSSSSDFTCGKKTNIALIKSGTQGGALTVNGGQLDACGTGRQSWRQLR